MDAVPYDEYTSSLRPLTERVDPTVPSAETAVIMGFADQLAALDEVTRDSLAEFIESHPASVPTLGLAVGLGQEKLKNALRHRLGTSGWVTLARQRPQELIEMLDNRYDLVRLLELQRNTPYRFGDVLVARSGSRATAVGAARAGRLVEDAIEGVAVGLGLPYAMRTTFQGRNDRTAPCDLAIPAGGELAQIVVAAKGFDSTGSKMTAAVSEVKDMAEVRLARQYVMAVVDGIGWLSRARDLHELHDLWLSHGIDGMYSLNMLEQFENDLEEAARRIGLL
jgi:hypothetical protein